MSELAFTVLGKPQPAGSKRVVRPGGNPNARPILADDNRRSKPWQALVVAAAHEAMRDQLLGPLMLEVTFYFARPAGHYGTGRNRERVKASSPPLPAVRPDITKLLRGVEDAMTAAGVWRDDAQIVIQTARKRYGRPERAEIQVAPVLFPATSFDLEP